MSEYVDKLKAMTDDELLRETEQMVWLSAYANNNPRSKYHTQVDACSNECYDRRKPWLYTKAFNEAVLSCGHTLQPGARERENPEAWTEWLSKYSK